VTVWLTTSTDALKKSQRPCIELSLKNEIQTMLKNRLPILVLIAALVAGCSSSGTQPDDSAGSSGAATDSQAGSQSGFQGESLGEGSEYLEPGMQAGDKELLQRTVIYFDFDTARIKPEFSEVLAAHARYVGADQKRSIRLEGHADERGSREYNIGLGERRSQAVRQVLMLQGAGTVQITTVSYGEERSAVSGSDEEAWAMNRRVEIIYSE
jgi:peptidoglycan-associated lipoprotein